MRGLAGGLSASAPVRVSGPRDADVGEARIFLDSIRGHRHEALFVTAIGNGLRQGELLALRWSDVDLQAGTVRVRHTLERGTRRIAEPKTARAKRTLELATEVRDVPAEHRRSRRVARIDGLVFCSRAGTALDSRNVTRSFQTALTAVGLPHQRFHDLRHAYATLLIEQGEDLGVVSRMLGHADFSTTSDVYAHLTKAMQGRAAERISTILRSDAVAKWGSRWGSAPPK